MPQRICYYYIFNFINRMVSRVDSIPLYLIYSDKWKKNKSVIYPHAHTNTLTHEHAQSGKLEALLGTHAPANKYETGHCFAVHQISTESVCICTAHASATTCISIIMIVIIAIIVIKLLMAFACVWGWKMVWFDDTSRTHETSGVGI